MRWRCGPEGRTGAHIKLGPRSAERHHGLLRRPGGYGITQSVRSNITKSYSQYALDDVLLPHGLSETMFSGVVVERGKVLDVHSWQEWVKTHLELVGALSKGCW